MGRAEGNSFFKSPVLYARKQTSSKLPWFPSVTKLSTSFIYIMFLALVLIITIISRPRSTSMVHSWNNATVFEDDHTKTPYNLVGLLPHRHGWGGEGGDVITIGG